jgi:hypothetical protein
LDEGRSSLILSDASYTDRMAAQRLKHLATLLHRLSLSRIYTDIEVSLWHRRRDIAAKYGGNDADRVFATSLFEDSI